MDYKKLDAIVDSYREDILETMKRWIAIPSVQAPRAAENAPFGKETRRMLDAAMADASSMGFETKEFDGYAMHAQMGHGEKTLGILCHLDVVPAGDGWRHDPWGAEIEDGRLYGRGVADDKGAAILSLYAMKAVREAGVKLKDGVRLILGCDEETGMTDMRYYAEHSDMPDYGFSPDAEFPVINIEKGGLSLNLVAATGGEDGAELPVYELYAGVRQNVVPGMAWAKLGVNDMAKFEKKLNAVREETGFELNCEYEDGVCRLIAVGQSAHASVPHLGRNAAGMLLIALDRLNAGGGSRRAIKGLAELLGLDGTGRAERRNEEMMCGQAVKSVAKYGMGVELAGSHTPHHVPAEHKVVKGLLKAYSEATGMPGYAFAIGGGTYSRCMPNTVAFGLTFPGDTDLCHMPDEYMEVDKMMLSARILARAICELAGEGEKE